MTQDSHQRAKERYETAKEAMHEQHARMREDLRFSNPADPQQWPDDVKLARKNRVCLTFDRTEQYRRQVINDGRKNKPGINVLPAEGGDIEVAKRLDGIIRHIEYRSRASIAYDRSLECAADIGLGWFRIVPEVVNAETNHQEVCIKRVHDPLSITPDEDWTEPDGSDLRGVFAETLFSKAAFKRQFPKAKEASWDSASQWGTEDGVLVLEYQYVEETKRNMIVCADPEGLELTLNEDDYWTLAKQIGYQPKVVQTFEGSERSVKWCKFNGVETLEETAFPSKWIGFIPVIGYESWVDGKRFLCGLTRRMRDAQMAYNYERSAMVEAIALQPKAPTMVAVEAIDGQEEHWKALNRGSPAYLPYNAYTGEGADMKSVPMPQRLSPPTFPVAFGQSAQIALGDLEASIGMNRSGLGQPNSATSGVQERERKEESDTATYHFLDNQSRSIEHAGRIIIDMIPRVMDTKRQERILGQDGKHSTVMVDPEGPAVQRDPRTNKIISINPGTGAYDARVVAGANYTSQRQSAAEGIEQILGSAPEMVPVLGHVLVKLRDFPDADKVSRMMLAMAPPQVQQIANEGDDEEPIPPKAMAQIQQTQQQLQQAEAMLDAGEKELERLEQENQRLKDGNQVKVMKVMADAEAAEANEETDRYNAETQRMKVGADAQLRDTQQRSDEAFRAEEAEASEAQAPAQAKPRATAAAAPAESQPMSQPDPRLDVLLQAQEQTAQQMEQVASLLKNLIVLVQAPRKREPVYDKNGEISGSVDRIDLPQTIQ
jgi:hypothetical protein